MKILYSYTEVKELNGLWLAMDTSAHQFLSKKYDVTVRTVKNWQKNNNVPSKYILNTVGKTLK